MSPFLNDNVLYQSLVSQINPTILQSWLNIQNLKRALQLAELKCITEQADLSVTFGDVLSSNIDLSNFSPSNTILNSLCSTSLLRDNLENQKDDVMTFLLQTCQMLRDQRTANETSVANNSTYCPTNSEETIPNSFSSPCTSKSTESVTESHLTPDSPKETERNDSCAEFKTEFEMLEAFVATFKQTRIKWAFTQGDVGEQLKGEGLSQTTISRFEALNLSLANMHKIKPLLMTWVKETETLLNDGMSTNEIIKWRTNALEINKDVQNTDLVHGEKKFKHCSLGVVKRKKRVVLNSYSHKVLDKAFAKNDRPSRNYMHQLAGELNVESNVIKNWFNNMRQRVKRMKNVNS